MKIREGWEQELLVARYASRPGFTKCFDHLLSCLSLSLSLWGNDLAPSNFCGFEDVVHWLYSIQSRLISFPCSLVDYPRFTTHPTDDSETSSVGDGSSQFRTSSHIHWERKIEIVCGCMRVDRGGLRSVSKEKERTRLRTQVLLLTSRQNDWMFDTEQFSDWCLYDLRWSWHDCSRYEWESASKEEEWLAEEEKGLVAFAKSSEADPLGAREAGCASRFVFALHSIYKWPPKLAFSSFFLFCISISSLLLFTL